MATPQAATDARAAGGRAWSLDQLAAGHSVPVFDEIPADLDTPVGAYLKLRDRGPSFLLESVEGGERLARFSFVGSAPRATLRFRDGHAMVRRADRTDQNVDYDDALNLVADVLAERDVTPNPELPRFQGGAVGYLGYDAAASFERLPVPERDTLGVPDGIFLYCDDLIVFDHVRQVMRIVCLATPSNDAGQALAAAEARIARLTARVQAPLDQRAPAPADGADHPVTASKTQAEFERDVLRAKEYIAAGDIIQVVPSLRFSRRLGVEPFAVYRALRRVNPSPYMFYLDFGDLQLAGASPEMLVQCEGRQARTRPIAGTRWRGADAESDAQLADDLLRDPKERAEHVMLVDLGRNDLGRVSAPGTVGVDALMIIERFSHVMHIVSDVSGTLHDGMRGIDALRACFPAGTLSGAPKIRAMEIIAELEGLRRGPYGGAVGYVSYSGDLDTAITIRSMVVRDGVAHIQAGGGIVADSDPTYEYNEARNKSQAILRAIELAEAGR